MQWQNIIDALSSAEIYKNIWISVQNVVTGFTIAFVVAIFIALILSEIKILGKIFYPIFEIFRPIPNAAWVPIAIIICATLDQSILFITFIGAFFPMFLTIYRAYNEVPNNYLNLSKLYKLNRFEKIWKITLPAILPSIFTALMLGISGAWLSVIMAEMISGKSGIGYYTWKNYTLLNYELVFLGIVIMGLLGAIFSLLFSLISKFTVFWNKKDGVQ